MVVEPLSEGPLGQHENMTPTITSGLHHGNNADLLPLIPSESVDLVLTAPPYDELAWERTWDFGFVSTEIERVLRPGGVLVWIVADQFGGGSETGESMRQALAFLDLRLNLFETMIMRYTGQGKRGAHGPFLHCWDYMFVFAKGRPSTINEHNPDNLRTYDCPERAENLFLAMPNEVAFDHIKTWTNKGDLVLDPFAGTGTVPVNAEGLGRNWIGIELDETAIRIAKRRLGCFAVDPHAELVSVAQT